MVNSKGYRLKKRHCNSPDPVNTDEGCEGVAYTVSLCDDDELCPQRKHVIDYAAKKCQEFSIKLPQLDGDGLGLQAPHESNRLWMACAIFCRRKDTGSYYTPRVDLNDIGLNPYFPDGTWCHKEGSENYYCLHHHCLPEVC